MSYIKVLQEISDDHANISNLDILAGKEIDYMENLKK